MLVKNLCCVLPVLHIPFLCFFCENLERLSILDHCLDSLTHIFLKHQSKLSSLFASFILKETAVSRYFLNTSRNELLNLLERLRYSGRATQNSRSQKQKGSYLFECLLHAFIISTFFTRYSGRLFLAEHLYYGTNFKRQVLTLVHYESWSAVAEHPYVTQRSAVQYESLTFMLRW